MNSRSNAYLKTLPGPADITRVELSNGITVLSRPNFSSPSVVLSGFMPVGSMYDPLDKLGLAHFTAVSLMRGTQQRTFQEIYNDLESVGATLGFGASVHTTSFGGRSLAEDLPLLLKLVNEALSQPAFLEEHVERLRAQMLTGLAIRAQDTADMASLTFDELVFPNHPYGRPEDGYTETIQRITRQDLVDFHQKYFTPRGMVIVVVGGVDPQRAIDQVRETLGIWAPTLPLAEPALELPGVPPIQQTERRHISLAGKSQTDLVMGSVGPRRGSPDYMPASLGNNVLGQFGMMGRIGDVVREQAGLAYHASTSLNAWIAAGSWEVSAGVNPANLKRAIDLILDELRRFVREPVTQEELSDSQDHFIGRLPLSLESNNGVAGALINLERFQLGLDYYQRYIDLVSSVTPELILETARKYLDPEKMAIVSAGPKLSDGTNGA